MVVTTNGLSLRQLAKQLGVSQPFLSQIKTGKRPLPQTLKEKLEALGAYHLLITDKQPEQGQREGNSLRVPTQLTVVGGTGLEPVTSAMSTQCSNQLS